MPAKRMPQPVLAVPKSGRLRDLFRSQNEFGLPFKSFDSRYDLGVVENTGPEDVGQISAARIRPSDAMTYMKRGAIDIAVVGLDAVIEAEAAARAAGQKPIGRVMERMDHMAECALHIAAPPEARIRTPGDLNGLTIATSFPATLGEWLKEHKVTPKEILPLDGSVESSVDLLQADAVCDLVDSGVTLAANGLEPRIKLYDSMAVVVRTNREMESSAAEKTLTWLANRFKLSADTFAPGELRRAEYAAQNASTREAVAQKRAAAFGGDKSGIQTSPAAAQARCVA
jgi:ATP phosphoribosyltransferase